jgi:hypothetical protein
MSLSRKLKAILFPSRTVLRSVEKRIETIQKGTHQLLAETRRSQIRNSGTFRNHLEKMTSSQAVTDSELSYSFRFTTSELEPEMRNHDPSKIVVATVIFGDSYRDKVKTCLDSHRQYCDKMGYAYADLRQPPSRLLRHPSWYKITLIHQLIKKGYRRIAFIDGDALITDYEVKLEVFFDQLSASGRDLMLANDESGLNMGIAFARESPSLLRLLDLIWMFNFDQDNENWEQYALRNLVDDFSLLQEKLLIVANPTDFNSFPRERAGIHKLNSQKNTWKPGDFICHFSGIRSPLLESLIDFYSKEAASSKRAS